MRKGFSIEVSNSRTDTSTKNDKLTLTQHDASTNNQSTVSTNNRARQISTLPKNGRKMESVGTPTAIKKISIRELAEAVGYCEGWNSEGSIAQQNLNACNIRKRCTAGMSKGFGKCKTAEDGFKLCETTLKWYIKRDKTLAQLIRYFSPKSDGNNPTTHTTCIAKKAGIDKNIKLNLIIH